MRTATRPLKEPINSIVILARECYGDAIMLTPLIAALKDRYPSTSIYIVAFTRIIYDFFSADRNIAGVYHAKREPGKYLFRFWPKKYDLLFNPKDHPSTHFAIQSRIIRARYKAGITGNGIEPLFDFVLDIAANTHESQRNLSLMQVIGAEAAPNCHPYIPEMPVSEAIAELLNRLPDNTYIGINISTGTPGGHRTFEQWSELIRSFPEERFVIFSAPGDLEAKRRIEEPHANVQPTPPTKNLYEVLQIINRLKLLVTPDTSLVHIAACSDKPLVAMYRYNPTDRMAFSPLSTLREVIVSPTQAVKDIANSAVTAAVKKLLRKI